MMTLREFITSVNSGAHYRVYLPNRDCLIFESFLKVHSPYTFRQSRRHHGWELQDTYYSNNKFDDAVRLKPRELDAETKHFLKDFGNYIVFRIEISSFAPYDVWKDNNEKLQFKWYESDPLKPDQKYIDCYNLFIIPR